MDNEQATIASAQETASEPNSATTDEKKPVEQEKPTETKPVEQTWKTPLWKAPSKDEYDKTIQSTASKAKYEILQELGINSVNEFKTKAENANKVLSDVATLKTENEHLKEDLVCKELQVDDSYKDDLITLVKAKTTDSKDFKAVAQEILNKNPNWSSAKSPVKIGIEKSEKTETSAVESKLAEKYDWLR